MSIDNLGDDDENYTKVILDTRLGTLNYFVRQWCGFG
jgi:hypothetical protein